jgi:predicted RNA-binding protein with PIN domain
MPLVIDGHNLIGQMTDLSLSDPDDEQKLVERLAAYRRRRRTAITVVFDPGPHGAPAAGPERRRPGIRILFAQPGQRADDVICRLVRRARDRQGVLVVTSDRAVRDEVRRLGARVVSAQKFARELAEPRPGEPGPSDRKEQPLSPSEVEAWLRVFAKRREPPRG